MAIKLYDDEPAGDFVEPRLNAFGVAVVDLDGGTKVSVDEMVLETFTGPRPAGHVAEHLDGNQ